MRTDFGKILSRRERLLVKSGAHVRTLLYFFLLFSFAALLMPAEVPAAEEPGNGHNGSGARIAVFDFENLSGFDDALKYVMPAVSGLLQSRGFDLRDTKDLDDFLIRERVRSTGYLPRELALKMGKELNVTAVLLGTVYSFSMGSSPQLGLSARLVDVSTGEILWSEYASATGDDFAGILDIGKFNSMEKLLPVVVGRAFASFSTTPPLKVSEETYRIAVMPFLNKTQYREAGMIPVYMFMEGLFKNSLFVPVEFGEVRTAIVNMRIRSRGEVDYRSISGISKVLDVDGILVGAVELYSDGRETGSAPEVVISARLIDARKNRLVWCDSYQMNGDEKIWILDFGKIRSVDRVAYKVIGQLIKKMEKTEWR